MDANSFAFRLKELLEHNRLSLQAVASVLGISRTAVHKWTRGGEIDEANLRRLADLLRVNWIWLRYGEQTQQDAQVAAPQALPMTDVRRKYTAEIMESEARMKLALENARIVTWEWNLLTDEVNYSSNVEQVYGWALKRNEEFWPLLEAADAEALQRIYARAFEDGQPFDSDFRLRTPDGELRWIASRATPIRDSAGRVVKMLGISMDNTARRQAEEGQRASRELLEALGAGTWRYVRGSGELECDAITRKLLGKRGNARLNDLDTMLACLQEQHRAAVQQAVQQAPAGLFRLSCQLLDGSSLQLAGKVAEDGRQVFGTLLRG
ncbi:PAS domain-containing protein [Pseudomonas sp. J452]|uniref:PAS domain-containing protein n=1 Tax=Pseudomonas sp. J452 TaxID=2898441 RepID=UPI0021ADDEEC|nr:PAS domain-containing protein [Pseudomonas sp. J452]UUY10324.1 PAS domain-containing protein [Pseudomonas sp. J452]